MMRQLIAALALFALSACAGMVPGGRPPLDTGAVSQPPPLIADSAIAAGLAPGPPLSSLALGEGDAAGALSAFTASCDKILFRDDASGLTRRTDWQAPCGAARSWTRPAREFFAAQFETAIVGDGQAFATGYFEPEIAGSRVPAPGYAVPVYAMPADLVRGWPDDIPVAERTGRPPLGRLDSAGRFVPYFERSEIEAGALAGRGLEIAWAADPIEFFFLQIQGSGLLRLPDGTRMRIGYAGQNGREYVGIGAVMRERGLIGDGPGQYPGSMQGIIRYLREHPEEGAELMRLNKSWIFFRELTTDGPLGSLEIPVRRGDSVAVDPKFVPYGAPVVLDLDRDVADGLWIAQDTGGAIKGANRFDTFWGNGDDAREIAGGMSGRGRAVLLLPKGTLARLRSR
ncbi:murein transglycosylase A [Qipengyuania sp.]|uniref:murein transglycosylase A n=1 Tax=Qipengyuania sp. TaxID=2004515 RepID=UPI0037358198